MARSVWGIHMKKMGEKSEPIDGKFIGIGWEKMGEDLSNLPDDRDKIKTRLFKCYPDDPSGRVNVHASVLQNFLHGISIGDMVVYLDRKKPTPMFNIAQVIGDCEYSSAGSPYPNRRRVKWIKRLPRANLAESTEKARRTGNIRSTVFKIHLTPQQFLATLGEKE